MSWASPIKGDASGWCHLPLIWLVVLKSWYQWAQTVVQEQEEELTWLLQIQNPLGGCSLGKSAQCDICNVTHRHSQVLSRSSLLHLVQSDDIWKVISVVSFLWWQISAVKTWPRPRKSHLCSSLIFYGSTNPTWFALARHEIMALNFTDVLLMQFYHSVGLHTGAGIFDSLV